MGIEFETPKPIAQQQFVLKTVAEEMMRSVSREMDENEHAIPYSYIEFMHAAMKATGAGSLAPREEKKEEDTSKPKRPPIGYQLLAHMLEMLSWGDVGMYLCTPGGGLGAAAVDAAATPEQKAKFLARFAGEKPTFAAMCMTEPGAGSDTSAIKATAVLDEKANEWVINGEKIFVTGGHKSMVADEKFGKGFIVVWASIDPSAGRAGMRGFVIEAGTPGVTVTKLEHKMGIRASDTAAISLVDVRVPFDHVLGSPTVERQTEKGFKKAMATFDATRPLVAATGLGVARAALEFVKAKLAENGVEIRYGLPRNKLTGIERDVIDMEIMLRSGWLMVIKAVWMADNKKPNALESSMSKVKAGDVTTRVTQKAVELMGPLGYSREFLLEKWFRDAKITDIYEGTGQINRLVVARQILGFSGRDLR
jgi:acyl-CoA dehydrogenase